MAKQSAPKITKFTNCLLLQGGALVESDLWVNSETGLIIDSQSAFYGNHTTPDQIIDLDGKIISPGFLDVQLNGAHGFDFSVPCADYAARLESTNRALITSGVTSYLPTVTSQTPAVYHAVLPFLGASVSRSASSGSESLGAHVEGPFLSPCKNGIHNPSVLLAADSFADIESCYGSSNLPNIRKLTAAPELGNMTSLIPELTARGIIYSIGHSDANLEQAQKAVSAGATMVTHMFNAMRPFGHRDPGIFGLLGVSDSRPTTPTGSPKSSKPASGASSPRASPRSPSARSSLSICSNTSDLPAPKPFFGLISDGIHLHPSSVKIAYNAHPEGTILVTDAMALAGLPDGTYEWTNGERIVKKGPVLTLEVNDRIAGSAVTLIECINNFIRFTGCAVAEALDCVTAHPAKMAGVQEKKGGLSGGMDADLCVLSENFDGELVVEQVWKFGSKVFDVEG